MTFNNWKELNIGGYDLKKLIRVSDGLVLFEKNVGPDYSEPFWVKGTYAQAGNHSQFVFLANDNPTTLNLEYSTDKQSWTPLEFYYNTRYNEWHSTERFSTREVNKIYFRSGSETPVNPGDFTLRTRSYSGTPAYRPFIIGGNLNSFICKDFKDIVDLSEMLSCFEEFFTYAAFADANKLLLPAKSIGEYGYRRLFGNTNTLSATQKMSFDVEEIGDSGMRAAFDGSAFKGHLAFTSLKSVGPYGMHVIGNGSRLSSIEFPENQISINYYGMNNLAKDDTNLKNVNHINVEVLSSYALTRAFEGCTSLSTVGGISGVTNSNCSYALSGLFNNCSSLVDVGDLDITANGSAICKCMFNNCTSLSAVKGKIFVRGGNSLERGFSNCVGLKDASQLSIRLESSSSGRYLFDGCSNLESMPTFILDPQAGSSTSKYQYAFRNCTNLKYVTPFPEVKPQGQIYSYMFQNCTSMTDAPEIMLSSINSVNCMTGMFDGCTNLSSVTVHFTAWPTTSRTTNWMRNVSPTGIFRCPAELEDKRGVNFIPEGWTKVDL